MTLSCGTSIRDCMLDSPHPSIGRYLQDDTNSRTLVWAGSSRKGFGSTHRRNKAEMRRTAMDPRPRDGAKTRADIREAAARLFHEHGYEATSLRSVAAEVGIKVGSLYNHMGGKDDLLIDIMMSVMDQLTPLVEAAAAEAGPDPIARLRAGIGAHISFHARHARETFIGNSELRSLQPEQYKLIVKRRRDYEDLDRKSTRLNSSHA